MSTNLLFLALLPGILIIIYVMRKDKVETEPTGLIVKLVLFGALSCIPAVFLETVVDIFSPGGYEGDLAYSFYQAFAVAACCEEFCKYLLLRLGSWKNVNFDYRFDGILYGVAVAVGFALLENILYVASGGISAAISRGILAVPLHAFCGVFMGIFYGGAKKYSVLGIKSEARKCSFLAFIVPIAIHGMYDFLIFINMDFSTIALLAFVVILYIIAIKQVNKYSNEDWSACFYSDKLSEYSGFYRNNF